MSRPASQLATYLGIVFLAAMMIFVSGCGAKKVANSSDPSETSAASPSSETSSVAAAKTTNQASPAASANKLPGPDTAPDEVCRRFMNLLQSGNRIGAENLLTRTALTTTTRAGLKLEPMGGPTSIYEIGDVRYATNKHKLAQVECTVVDNVDGENYEMEITWQLHKHATGWRISGVMLALEPGQVKDLLSFENIHDVARLQSLANAEVLDEDATRQAKASPDPSMINK